MSVAPRVCKKCLYVVKSYNEKISEPRRCPHCGTGILTQYFHKVAARVTDDSVIALFGVKPKGR